jgi:hypothetical protein
MNYKRLYYYLVPSCIILFTLIYFSFPLIFTYDSSHYMKYVDIFNGVKSWSQWDPARGIIFPLFFRISKFFGNTQSALSGMIFPFFLLLLSITVYFFTSFLKVNSYKNKSLIFLFVFAFLALDPLLFGYFHVALTEFLASTIMIFSCFLVYYLLKNYENINKYKFYLINIYFVLFAPIAWHLKQPYVTAVFLPFLSIIFVLISKKVKFKDYLKYFITFILMISVLFLSNIIWSKTIETDNQKFKLRTSDAFLKSQILSGMLEFELNSININENEKIQYLKESDKKLLNDNKDNKEFLDEYKIVTVKNIEEQIKSAYLIQLKNTTEDENNRLILNDYGSLLRCFSTALISNPRELFSGYIYGYFGIANVFEIYNKDMVLPRIKNENFSMIRSFENRLIAYRVYSVNSNVSNIFFMPQENYNYISSYESNHKPSKLISNLFKITEYKSNFIFSFTIFILPLVLVLFSIKIFKKAYDNIDLFIFISSFISFFHIILHVFLGAYIDRYIFPVYTLILMIFVLLAFKILKFLIKLIKRDDLIVKKM